MVITMMSEERRAGRQLSPAVGTEHRQISGQRMTLLVLGDRRDTEDGKRHGQQQQARTTPITEQIYGTENISTPAGG